LNCGLGGCLTTARCNNGTCFALLSAENLTKRFNGVCAVDQLSLTVAPGEIFALLGPNGAGKTTTINCFLGFVEPDAGRVTVDALDVATHAIEAKRRLAYIPEQVNLYDHFSGVENLAYSASSQALAMVRPR
jgi:ABC-2 type transport system ATP-binding protein